MQRCVDQGHVFRCPRHPERFCSDKTGKSCVLCIENESRFETQQGKEKRVAREAEVAAALATRAETFAAGKIRWDDKLPTINRLAKSAANKAQQALKTGTRQDAGKRNGAKVWKGAKGEIRAKSERTENIEDNKAKEPKQDEIKGKSRLRIQRGQ